jgi:hypothetical protein
MPASWPTTIPQYMLISSYSEEAPNNLISSSVSVGPAKVRRRTTAGVGKISGSFLMSSAEVALFEAFVSSDIQDGALAFTFPNQRGSGTKLVRLIPSYSIAPSGANWNISVQLEVLP